MSPASQFALEIAIALMCAPLAVEAGLALRRRVPLTLNVAGLILAAGLAVVFVWPSAELSGVTAAQSQRGAALPDSVLVALLRTGRLHDLQQYFDARLGAAPRVDSAGELLILARTARLSGWQGTPIIGRAVEAARTRADLASTAALVGLVAGARPHDWPDGVFVGGARLHDAGTSSAAFVGFSTRDAGDDRCDVVVLFEPLAPLSGDRVWLHQYPKGAQSYIDVGAALPPSQWQPGELGWEIFRTSPRAPFVLYAGTTTGDSLGPAVLLGSVEQCGPPDR